jgi:ABC-type transport system involved in multi-copper enzyme maturation permease subunit
MRLLLITRFTFQEALRRRLFLAVVILSIVLLIAFTLLLNAALNTMITDAARNAVPSQWDVLGAGIYVSLPAIWLVYMLSSILTVFLTVNMISGEIEAGTFAIIIPKPIRRYEIVLGKWFGYILIVGVYTAFLFYAFLVIIYWKTGYWPAQALSALAMLELSNIALIGLATLGSTLFPTIVNGAVIIILFIGAPIASFVASFAQLAAVAQDVIPPQNDVLQNTITIINLIIPTDALWHGTSFYLLSPVALDLLGSGASIASMPIISAEQVTGALLLWVVVYSMVLPALAVWRFQTRDV